MFSYYGAKTKIVNKYPEPLHETIIEPFAGSARYALKYWDRRIILIEKYEPLYKVWVYLRSASKEDILNLPDVPPSSELIKIDGFSNLRQEEKWLIGLCSNRGSNAPKNFSGSFCSWSKDKIRISQNLHKIRHWDIFHGDYKLYANMKATWFVDPPYQNMGKLYKENKIDYQELGTYCRERLGQVMVCENEGADWLPFEKLTEITGQRKKSVEVVWYNN